MWLYSSVPPAFWSVREDSKYAAHLKKKGWVSVASPILHVLLDTVCCQCLPIMNLDGWLEGMNWLFIVLVAVSTQLQKAAKNVACIILYMVAKSKPIVLIVYDA